MQRYTAQHPSGRITSDDLAVVRQWCRKARKVNGGTEPQIEDRGEQPR